MGNLVTIRTYADMTNRSKERIRQKIHAGELPSKIIDGVIFVVLTDEEVKQRNEARRWKEQATSM